MNVIDCEYNFDKKEKYKKKEAIKLDDYIEINISTEEEPRNIKIEKGASDKERKDLIELVKEYINVFAFTYDELKSYRDDLFQHTIPLRSKAKPFRKKLRIINLKLASMVQKELQKC